MHPHFLSCFSDAFYVRDPSTKHPLQTMALNSNKRNTRVDLARVNAEPSLTARAPVNQSADPKASFQHPPGLEATFTEPRKRKRSPSPSRPEKRSPRLLRRRDYVLQNSSTPESQNPLQELSPEDNIRRERDNPLSEGDGSGRTIRHGNALKTLRSVKATQEGLSAAECIELQKESPWKYYRKVFGLTLDHSSIVAIRKSSYELTTAKSLSGPEGEGKYEMLRQIRHENVIALLDCFECNNSLHVFFEHVEISLTQIVACPAYPNERQLAAMLRQVSLTVKTFIHMR